MQDESYAEEYALGVAPKKKKLEDGQGLRVFAEDRFRDLQRENHGSLFDYERREAHAVCDGAAAELKAGLAAELGRKRDLIARLRAQAAARVAALEAGTLDDPSVGVRGPRDDPLEDHEA
eukprot:CAMPEP_0119266220 /NCGR_PEP_ID=MMETSP1329-20130426/4782_1 /TAXON_ID=114041 /ORGANISM="Genus nov. species nov., Strain RCC1024" /LENGTH=119 /DNA_ID=CAMNT_0007266089 /DNA_START=160 /DNA_END=516 /DNA_ORIENTATION=-